MKSISVIVGLIYLTTTWALTETLQSAVASIEQQTLRRLEAGDFDRFNELFKDASIQIPGEFEVSEKIVFTRLRMTLKDITCYDMSIGDVSISHVRNSNQAIDVLVDVVELDLRCDISYRYTYGILRGTGHAQVSTDNNWMNTRMTFASTDFNTQPPVASEIDECTANFQITDINFQGDFVSNIVEIFEKLIRNTIEDEIEKVACDELASLGTTFVGDMLGVAAELLDEYQGDLSTDVTDPLYVEENANLPSDLLPLDLLDTENVIGDWFNQALREVDSMLATIVPDPDGPTSRDLGINVFLRSSVLDDNRALVIDVDDLPINPVIFQGHDRLTETTITLNQVRILGLDTFTHFNPLDRIGHYTLQTEMIWETLVVEFDATVDILPSTREDSILEGATSEGISERINIDFGVDDVEVVASLFLVIDQEALGTMELGPLLFKERILPCLLSVVHDLELSGLHVDPHTVNEPTLTGFVSPGIDRIVSDAVEAVFAMYTGVLEHALPKVFQTTVRNFINDEVIESFIPGNGLYLTDSQCRQVDVASLGTGFVDFRDLFLSTAQSRLLGGSGASQYGDLFRTVMDYVQDLVFKVDQSTGLSTVNDVIIGPLTRSQSNTTGTIAFAGDLFSGNKRVQVGGLDATVELRASDARIDNLDTIGVPMDLLAPVEGSGYRLNNTATFGVDGRPLRFGVRFLLSLSGDDDQQIRNDMEISLDLLQTTLMVEAMIKAAEARFYDFPLRDLLNSNCWLAMIPAPELDARGVRLPGVPPTASLVDLLVSISELNLNISCIECSSPRMPELTELLASPQAQEDATEVANRIVDYVSSLLGGNFLQVQFDQMLMDAARKCPHSDLYDADFTSAVYESFEATENEHSISFLMLLGGVTIGLILLLSFVVLTVRCFVRRRHQKWLVTLPQSQVARLAQQQEHEQRMEQELNEATESMYTSPEIPLLVRWSMPVVIVGNIAFFLSGHLSLGATVNIEAEIAGEKLVVDKFFEFSMARSTVDIWNAGGRELAVLMLIFSGIWPYTKQLITLALWFMPPARLSVSKRGSILLWLDWLAKWSMIDIFVLVISIAAFRVSIVSPSVGFLPADFYAVNLLVVPLWGLYANMIAQLISQVSSHFIIHYHRKVALAGSNVLGGGAESATMIVSAEECDSCDGGEQRSNGSSGILENVTNCNEKAVLCEHEFGRPHRAVDEKLVIRSWINRMLLAAAGCLAVLVLTGCILPSFSLKILGLIGVVVESGQGFEDATTKHNIFTVVKLLIDEARFLDSVGDFIGLGTLSILLIFTVLLVPMVQCGALLYQWFYPSTRADRSRVAIYIEILQAWQYAEVYLIAIFVASWQLGPISEFMVNSYCDSLQGTFSQWVYYGIIKEEDAQCFSVQSSIEAGSFLLALGAVVLALINTFVNKAVAQYFRDTDRSNMPIEQDNDGQTEEGEELGYSEKYGAEMIHPIRVMFTDTFRWLLVRKDGMASSRRCLAAVKGDKFSFLKRTTRTFADDASELKLDVEICGTDGYEQDDLSGNVMVDVDSDTTSHVTSDDDLLEKLDNEQHIDDLNQY